MSKKDIALAIMVGYLIGQFAGVPAAHSLNSQALTRKDLFEAAAFCALLSNRTVSPIRTDAHFAPGSFISDGWDIKLANVELVRKFVKQCGEEIQ